MTVIFLNQTSCVIYTGMGWKDGNMKELKCPREIANFMVDRWMQKHFSP